MRFDLPQGELRGDFLAGLQNRLNQPLARNRFADVGEIGTNRVAATFRFVAAAALRDRMMKHETARLRVARLLIEHGSPRPEIVEPRTTLLTKADRMFSSQCVVGANGAASLRCDQGIFIRYQLGQSVLKLRGIGRHRGDRLEAFLPRQGLVRGDGR